MNKFNCKHKWAVATDYRERREVGALPTILSCNKCGINMSAHEAAEVALWKNTVGVQKWISIGAFLIALASLVISVLK